MLWGSPLLEWTSIYCISSGILCWSSVGWQLAVGWNVLPVFPVDKEKQYRTVCSEGSNNGGDTKWQTTFGGLCSLVVDKMCKLYKYDHILQLPIQSNTDDFREERMTQASANSGRKPWNLSLISPSIYSSLSS